MYAVFMYDFLKVEDSCVQTRIRSNTVHSCALVADRCKNNSFCPCLHYYSAVASCPTSFSFVRSTKEAKPTGATSVSHPAGGLFELPDFFRGVPICRFLFYFKRSFYFNLPCVQFIFYEYLVI